MAKNKPAKKDNKEKKGIAIGRNNRKIQKKYNRKANMEKYDYMFRLFAILT